MTVSNKSGPFWGGTRTKSRKPDKNKVFIINRCIFIYTGLRPVYTSMQGFIIKTLRSH